MLNAADGSVRVGRPSFTFGNGHILRVDASIWEAMCLVGGLTRGEKTCRWVGSGGGGVYGRSSRYQCPEGATGEAGRGGAGSVLHWIIAGWVVDVGGGQRREGVVGVFVF